jgi:FkbM family methyltransferase
MGGVQMLLDTDEHQQRLIYWTGSYDPRSVKALAHHLPHDGVLIDIGAGIGSICLFVVNSCLQSGKKVNALAFEPMGLNYDRLVLNTDLNHFGEYISCYRLALSAEKGTLNLCFPEQTGSAAVIQSGSEVSVLAGATVERVPCDTLDAWVSGHELTRLDVLKVDIEGSEPLMFRGALETIERFRPAILGEFNNWWAEQHGLSIAEDCFGPLWDFGYEVFRLDSRCDSWQRVPGRPAPGPEMEDTLWIHPQRLSAV